MHDRGKIGKRVRTKTGKYEHERAANPVKGAKYRSKVTKRGRVLRFMKPKGKRKMKLQAILRPIKK